MKFPCPECERPLAPDLDWEYCPYCGSLLHHSSRVAEWRELERYVSFGSASFASDHLMSCGIPSRIRAEVNSDAALAFPYHAIDVDAEAFGEAQAALAALHSEEHDDEIEPDAPPNAIAEKTASYLMQFIIFGFGAVILIAVLGAIASWASKEFFGG